MRSTWKPWHEVVQLRDDVRTGELSLAVFAADLYDVVMRKGKRSVYEDPAEFFTLTYPTYNLRELVKDVALRLARQSDKAYRTLSVNYGGGKTHTLITLKHLLERPAALPSLPAIKVFEEDIGQMPPPARCAALCFDKIDLEKGVETLGPDGSIAILKRPWSILAYQIAGAEGLRLLHAEGKDLERDTPPAEPVLSDLLSKPQRENFGTLVLLDEVLMYLRDMVETDRSWRGRLISFFQHLTSSVVKVDRCAMVASLRASDPNKHDSLGTELLTDVSDVFGRQMEVDASPVSKEDVAEVLRRRFFTLESLRDQDAFRPQVTAVLRGIAALDEETKKGQKAEEKRYLDSYPFHPALTETLYTRWTQVERFQRTRGILRTFAVALRDAEKWDTSPLIGPNVFLAEPGKSDLTEAASELASFASVDGESGRTQEWRPILEGELDKAATIQSEATGLSGREMEQAVMSVFLSSQPIGQKALTPELMVLIGAANPDKIELGKALRRWTELSWFLDEHEIDTGESDADGAAALPKAWRLGNRPNLRQMHHAACTSRVPPELVDSQVIEMIEKQKTLTSDARAAGARVHNLPARPRDIEDDGDFHYAVLGPSAVSESGKPSAEAKRFINETTAADRPRANRNAVVLAVPSRDGLEVVGNRVREYLGWKEVRNQLEPTDIDPIREQMLLRETDTARMRIPGAVKQAYSIVVTVSQNDEIHAFKVVVTDDDPLFTTLKNDKRSRIQETAISAEAMLPGGPYDLWREDEPSRRVRDLVGAFAQSPKLPKMLRSKGIMDTVVGGVQQGIWVAQVVRPDRTTKTFWRTAIDESALQEPGLEVMLPESATLSELSPGLLKHQALPGLWSADEITVQNLYDYFAGGHVVSIPKDGYEEPLTIPKCEPEDLDTAVSQAVEQGILWLTNGPASILNVAVPPGVLNASASLRPPPDPITVQEFMEAEILDAWKDRKTNALALATALSNKRGVTLPWHTVKTAISGAIQANWIKLSEESGEWPCEFPGAQNVLLEIPPEIHTPDPPPYTPGVLVAKADLEAHGIQDLADQIPDITAAAVGTGLKFNIRIEFGGETRPDPEAVEKINELLAEVDDTLKLK